MRTWSTNFTVQGLQTQLLYKQRPTPSASVATGRLTGLSHASLCPWQKATASPCTSPMTSPHDLPRLIKLFICPGQHLTKAKRRREAGRAEGRMGLNRERLPDNPPGLRISAEAKNACHLQSQTKPRRQHCLPPRSFFLSAIFNLVFSASWFRVSSNPG